ncbi:MAG: class IV adenylate cyclase [Bryobacteraceae bacterium]|nr:class IV adenylate cyclase [Bryobacteraceae bacterium]
MLLCQDVYPSYTYRNEESMSENGVETEIKLRVQDEKYARDLFEINGLRVVHERAFEANCVYDTAGGEVRSRGHLLRLRSVGDKAVLTWKGTATSGIHKSRPETEVIVSDFVRCDSLLKSLGYGVVFRYEKFRTEFSDLSDGGIATLDETPIGTFLELEGPSEWIDRLAGRLGFTADDYITASYGTLYLEYCETNQLSSGFMLFGE